MYDVTSSRGEQYRDGYRSRSVAASYVHLHLHLGSSPELVRSLLRSALC